MNTPLVEGNKETIRQQVATSQDGVGGNGAQLNGNGNRSSVWFNQESIPAHFAPLSLRLVLIGWALGMLAGLSLVLASPLFLPSKAAPTSGHSDWHWWRIFLAPQLHLYLAAWSTFHLLEFVVTARWNPTRLMKDSFLLQNGWNYHAAHLGGIVEFLLESLFFHDVKLLSPHHPTTNTTRYLPHLIYLGLLLLLLGQLLRSYAMICAAANFSHQVAHKKRDDHMLVTSGVYAWVRHPSYTGFFVWAASTQLVLANPVGVVVFAGVLWRFFSLRIKCECGSERWQAGKTTDITSRPLRRTAEEASLVAFFGKEYEDYRRKVPSGIPFVR